MNDNNIKTTIASDNIYQRLTWKREIFNRLFWFPFVRLVPRKFGHWLFTRTNEHTNLVAKYAKTHRALELVYGYDGFKLNGNGITDSLFTHFWESNLINGDGVRNRFYIVKNELKKIIREKTASRKKLKLLSLASGSARAVIEVLAELKNLETIKIEARFVDSSRDALNYSKQLADSFHVTDRITLKRANVMNRKIYHFEPDVVEVVGLMDYLDNATALELITNIYQGLASDGVLIISNINPNPESRFFTEIVDWQMIYRSPKELGALLIAAGFENRYCQLIQEPLKVHTVAIASKIHS